MRVSPLILKQDMTHRAARTVFKTIFWMVVTMFIVGIDIAKRTHVVSVMTSEGQIVCKPFSIRNNCSGYNLLLERLRKISNIKSAFTLAMESTAHYWLPLYTRLRREGWNVVVMNPLQTHAVRELLIRETKTDAVDAQLIAEVIRFGRVRSSSVPQEELLALRELCRNRFYLMDLASDLKRKITALLDQVFPEFEAQFDSIFCKSGLAVLRRYPTPERLAPSWGNSPRSFEPPVTVALGSGKRKRCVSVPEPALASRIRKVFIPP